MSDSLRDRIAAVQSKHHHWDFAGALTCACGEDFGLDGDAGWESAVQEWAKHVADAVIAELGLRREDNEADFTGSYRHRYVTDWRADDE